MSDGSRQRTRVAARVGKGAHRRSGARRTQVERSAEMRRKLVTAAIAALVDKGYARTTTVEVCERAGVTRGAFVHHFDSPAQLFAEALRTLYGELATPGPPPRLAAGSRSRALSAWIDSVWATVGRPEFKAVIEIWLAGRNDPDVRKEILDVVEQFKPIFSPEHDRSAFRRAGSSARVTAFHRLVIETTIGLSLGRAVTPSSERKALETATLTLLKELSSEL
jgi:AcrR family transcriptional regulator